MSKEFNIHYMYEMIKISIVDLQVKEEVQRDEFYQAYFKKLIKLSIDRQNRQDYKETKSFWRNNYLMNTLKIISLILKDKIEIEGLEYKC